MNESYYKTENAHSFIRYSSLMPKRKTLLFLHGIGDSSISYLPFLNTPILSQFNIIIPDFLGYGKSSKNDDYSFTLQIQLIIEHIKSIEKQIGFLLNDLILTAHSMGGIHAMLLCDSEIKNRIKGVINVEGSITQYGSFISETVSKISPKNFQTWFQNFKENTIFNNFIKEFPACRSYYASLQFCQAEAFFQNALEMHQVCISGKGEYTNHAGQQFCNLDLPKIYFYGDKSLCQESQNFLHMNRLPTKIFQTNNHFVMLQCFDEFTHFIANWMIQI